MKVQFLSTVAVSALLGTFASCKPDEAPSNLSFLRRDLNQPTIDQMMPFLELNSSINWMDDGQGQGGRFAQIDDDAWDIALGQAHAAMQERGLELFKRQTGDVDVPDDAGAEHEVTWVCRQGTGQEIVRSTAATAICGGVGNALTFAATGKFIWSSPPTPDTTGKLRSLVVLVTKIATGVGFQGTCTAIVSRIAGENGCPPATARLLERQSATDNAGGQITVFSGPDGGDVVATFDFGVPS